MSVRFSVGIAFERNATELCTFGEILKVVFILFELARNPFFIVLKDLRNVHFEKIEDLQEKVLRSLLFNLSSRREIFLMNQGNER